ncbi:MAG: cyclic pyranopterin monophosphate synthase MoaC [Desulfurococcales archaeon]|nr:cyclic pyranopterin monophosphate synthase MoaC [Desulfurococcales archaeon]
MLDLAPGIVDITGKNYSLRSATVEGRIRLQRETINRIKNGAVDKGDVLEVARVAALLAIKKTPEIIPHCHPIPLTGADVEFDIDQDGITVRVTVKAIYKTGVEMEALTGATAALLTIWDMVKKYEKDSEGQYPYTRIEYVRVLRKEKQSLREERV